MAGSQAINDAITCMKPASFAYSCRPIWQLFHILSASYISCLIVFAHLSSSASLILNPLFLGWNWTPATESYEDCLGKRGAASDRLSSAVSGVWGCHALGQDQELCIYRSACRLILVGLRLHVLPWTEFESSSRDTVIENRDHRCITPALLAATLTGWQRGEVLSQLASVNETAQLSHVRGVSWLQNVEICFPFLDWFLSLPGQGAAG